MVFAAQASTRGPHRRRRTEHRRAARITVEDHRVRIVEATDGQVALTQGPQRRLTACVECLPSGEVALMRRPAHTFALLERMPGPGGLETLKGVREADPPSKVPLTGRPDDEDLVTTTNLGALHSLRKPTEPPLSEEAPRWRRLFLAARKR